VLYNYSMQNVPLKNYSTSRIGGGAKYFEIAQNANDLIRFAKVAIAQNLPYFILGSGSNILFGDHGFPGLIIKNENKGISLQGLSLQVQSGTLFNELVKFTVKNGFSGMQNMIGIPGTLGGAIVGNSGAYGQYIADHISKVVCFDPSASPFTTGIITLDKKGCQFSYRDSIFKKGKYIILNTHFNFPKGKAEDLQKEMDETLAKRQENYSFTAPCPGSFFKNVLVEKVDKKFLPLIPKKIIRNGKIPAGYLLEQVGACGKRIKDVQVSKHANIFVNLGKGRTIDYLELSEMLAKKVKDGFGIELEREVQIVGNC